MQKIDAEQLLIKYREGRCSDEELALLENWYNQYRPTPFRQLSDQEWAEDAYSVIKAIDDAAEHSIRYTRYTYWRRIAAAACFVAATTASVYYLTKTPLTHKQPNIVSQTIGPGTNKAILTLANGQQIVLTSGRNRILIKQSGISISQLQSGVVAYQRSANASYVTGSNKITTPAGGQYRLVMEDGTQVFLNAMSSITYPATFSGTKRSVEITGEAYFEVKHDVKRPFEVICRGQTIRVLGTHFNVNSYIEEPTVKTTLLQGSVKIIHGDKTDILVPGQQASVSETATSITNADIDQAVGWKNGDFIFNNEDLPNIMRQITRWYDVKVVYTRPGNNRKFIGTISRSKKLDEILKALEMNQNVHFKMERRTIEVTP